MTEESLIYLGGSSVDGSGPGLSSTGLKMGGRSVMIDCGIEILKGRRYRVPDFSILGDTKVSALVNTHAHLDHIGSVGLASERMALKSGAKIYGSPQTNAWLPSVIAETWCRGVGQNYYMCNNRVIDMLKDIPFGEFELLPGIPAFTGAAGHVPGALYIIIRTPSGKRILFCGDNSWHDQAVVKGSRLPDDVPDKWLPDVVAVLDLTNPSLTKLDYGLEMGRLVDHVVEALAKKKTVVIAAFAYGRVQNVALDLAPVLAKAGLGPVYVDGSATDVFDVFEKNRWSPNDNEFSLEGIKLISDDEVTGIRKGRKRAQLLDHGGPLCIAAPAGFGDGGPVRYFLEKGINNPNFEFIASSWLLPGCTMERLLQKVHKREETRKKVYMKLEDENSEREELMLEVKCDATHFRPGAHGGLGDNVEMIKKIVARRGKKLEMIGLTHASYESKQVAAGVLRQYADSTIPIFPGTEIRI